MLERFEMGVCVDECVLNGDGVTTAATEFIFLAFVYLSVNRTSQKLLTYELFNEIIFQGRAISQLLATNRSVLALIRIAIHIRKLNEIFTTAE